jgi:hypothetical protein
MSRTICLTETEHSFLLYLLAHWDTPEASAINTKLEAAPKQNW